MTVRLIDISLKKNSGVRYRRNQNTVLYLTDSYTEQEIINNLSYLTNGRMRSNNNTRVLILR